MPVDPIEQSTVESVALANAFDPNKRFSAYKLLVDHGAQAVKLQQLIDKQTEELAEAKRGPPGEFQRTLIHQINNILFRSGYELDQTQEEYRHCLNSCIEELQIDFGRMKSNWAQEEDQMFQLQVILAKCEFLKSNSKNVPGIEEVPPPLNDLVSDIDKFTAAHLTPESLPDSCLDTITQIVQRLLEVLGAAYDMSTEVPSWHVSVVEPKSGDLSAILLNEIQSKIKTMINDIPSEVSKVQRLLPDGIWRKESDLRPEIYAFAEILFPLASLLKLPVRDILQFLDNSPESRLRRALLDTLKSDSTRCKEWLETREQHELMLQQAVSLAKEGNYLQAEQFVSQTPPFFSDLNYTLYKETSKFWIDQREQLRKRMDTAINDLKGRLANVFRQPVIPLPRARAMKRQLDHMLELIEKEIKVLQKYSQTDFYQDSQPIIKEARSRLKEVEAWATKQRNFCRGMAWAEAGVVCACLGGFLAIYMHTLQVTECSLTVHVASGTAFDNEPEVRLGSFHKKGFNTSFQKLEPGTYPLTIESVGYYPNHYDLRIEPGKKMVWGPITLRPIKGSLRLEPAGGDYDFQIKPLNEKGEETDPITLDETAKSVIGHVPKDNATSIDLRPGRYRVYLWQGERGSPDGKEFDTVSAIAAHEVTSYKPDFSFGTLDIMSDPMGATVSIDGKAVGTTPFAKRLAPINYSLSVSMDNYQSYYAPIQLKPDGNLPLNIKLKPKSEIPLTGLEPPPAVPPSVPTPSIPSANNQTEKD